MRRSDPAGASSPDSEGKRVAAVARTSHSCSWNHRPKDLVAQIEVVEECRGCMHAGSPEDGVAEGGVHVHDQLPQSMRLRDRGSDVESGQRTDPMGSVR